MTRICLLEPVTEYGVSKAAATLYCQALARNGELPLVTLRLFSPYGPYEQKSRLIPSVILGRTAKNESQNHITAICKGFHFY